MILEANPIISDFRGQQRASVFIDPVCDFDAREEGCSGAHLVRAPLDDVLGFRPQAIQRLGVDPRRAAAGLLGNPLQHDGLQQHTTSQTS
jgi:hypothetical protein